jgi:adenylate cyclase
MTEIPPAEPAGPDRGGDRRRLAQEAGAEAVDAVRRLLARRTATLLRSDPEAAELASEMGLVDPLWLEHPTGRPTMVAPLDVLERFLERSVEQRPSRLRTIGLSAVQLVAASAAPERTGAEAVTVVFTDLEGFTNYTDVHGDDEAVALIRAHHRAAGPIVRRWQGRIVKRMGDGLLCAFPTPVTGVRAAIDLLPTAPEPLALRAGVHTGEALVSRSDVMGQVVNIAARVAERARGGEVAVSGEVASELGGVAGIDVGRGRRTRLKGVSTPVTLHSVTSAAP